MLFLELDDFGSNMQKDETGLWYCLQCSFSSRKVSHVKTHVESKHLTTGGFICSVCSKVSATRESLRKHMTRLHSAVDVWYIQNKLWLTFWHSFILGLDEAIAQNIRKDELGVWSCAQCAYSSDRSSNVRNHIEAKHMTSSGFQCPNCSKIEEAHNACHVSLLSRDHVLNKHSLSALTDAIKEKIFKSAEGLFSCYECGYSSKYKTTCQDHIEARHLSTSGYVCSYCQKFCPTRNALKSHISKNHKMKLM